MDACYSCCQPLPSESVPQVTAVANNPPWEFTLNVDHEKERMTDLKHRNKWEFPWEFPIADKVRAANCLFVLFVLPQSERSITSDTYCDGLHILLI